MNILIDLTSLADNFSGIERYAACLALEMIKDINHLYILIFKEEIHYMFKTIYKQKNIKIYILKRCNKLFFNQVRLPIEIYKHKADYYLFLAFPVPVILFKKNMVSTIHDICCWDCPETMTKMSKWYFRISNRIAIIKCKSIITISRFSKRRIQEYLNYNENKIWLVYCGIDEKFRSYKQIAINNKLIHDKYNLPEQYILSLSTLEPRKNLKLLIDAYRDLYNENKICIPLVLAGRQGWKMDEFFKNIKIEEEVKKNIYFTGFIDDDDLPAVYADAELFVFPSLYEGFGMPPLEALACGTKVLVSDSSSMPEVLGDEAVYFKNGNKKDLKDKLEKNIKNKTKLNTKLNTKFNWKTEANKILEYMYR